MRKISFVLLLIALLSLGAADFCIAQWQPENGERGFPHHRFERDQDYQAPIPLPKGKLLKPEETNTILGIIKNDFLVNDDTTGGCRQWYSAVAMDTSGNFVVCWEDYRNGELDIYAQRFSNSGDTLGSNFMVNNDLGSTPQLFPSIAMDVDGDFVICWEDERNGDWDIYAQRFTSSGDTVGGNFRVNDDEGIIDLSSFPSVAMDVDGGFIVCWGDYRNGDWGDIYAQRYTISGDTLGGNFRVNDDEGTSRQGDPSVAIDGDGNFVICWEDGRNGDRDIYAQRYSSLGDRIGSNFQVNDDVETNSQWSPSISMDGKGNFVISWEDGWNIYAQRFTSSGDTVGGNFRVNDDVGEICQKWYSSVAMDTEGGFVICWQHGDIYAQRYSNIGDTLGTNFRVSYSGGSHPSIAMDTDGSFVICWEDRRNGWDNPDIYAQRYSSSGDTLGGNFRVNDDEGTSRQGDPSVAMDGEGDFIICWEDERNGDSDIYAQRYSSSGGTVGSNFQVIDDEGRGNQLRPSVSMGLDGNFIISWDDYREDSSPDIYAQRYTISGDTLGKNFRVNDDEGENWQSSSSIAIGRENDFIICWHDYRNSDCDIYAQRYHSDGTRWGINYLVNQKPGGPNPCQWGPSVALNDDNITFAWTDARRCKGWDIYAKVVTWDWDKVDEPRGNDLGLPKDFALFQNYPNPFNSTTAISYQLSAVRPHHTTLKIYNVLGQEVKTLVDEEQPAGDFRVLWDGRDNSGNEVSSGVYFCRLEVTGDKLKVEKMRKMVLIR